MRSLESICALPDEALITPDELGRLLSVDPRLLSEWRVKRRGPAFEKVGHQVRYRMGEVRAWRRAQRRETVS